MKFKKRHVLVFLVVPIIGLIAFFGIRSFVFSRIEARVAEKLSSLKASGFTVHYDSLIFSWQSNTIELRGLLLKKKDVDTTCVSAEFISIQKIRGEGFRLIPLLLRNVLSFEAFYLDEPRLLMHKNPHASAPPSSKREKDFTLQVDRTHFNTAAFSYADSTCNVTAEVSGDVTIDGLTLDFLADGPLAYQANWLLMKNTEVQLPTELYRFKIQRLRMDFLKALLEVDSATITPTAGKLAFGRMHGFEVDRFEGLIPFIRCQQISFSAGDTARVASSLAEVQFYLKIFRDKHQPFLAKKKLLPTDQLAELPFGLSIDSLKIRKSYVQYEEYAEGAATPGKVYFDNLYASIYNIDNKAGSGFTELRAQADLQGKGRIDLAVTFPLEAHKRAKLEGTLTNFEMAAINSILVPSTNIKVESGNMEKLAFNFAFDRIRSDGELELQYSDLKLAILKEEDKQDGDVEKDNFKTFMMNTFIFRTDMDEDVPEEKRTGAIGFMRDNNRSIFNFWVKSIVSGIKSAYNLDKAEAKKTEKELRKEQRLARREARKQRRAERKRG